MTGNSQTPTATMQADITILQQFSCHIFLASAQIEFAILSMITIMGIITHHSDNLMSSNVCYHRGETILNRKEQIRLDTVAPRRQMPYDNQAQKPDYEVKYLLN